ncbi:transcription factor IIA, alpha/beta subunit [Delitschia confertaspora ATCC 74209]|uniref:Transcription factor IIA, alpha/beta subunit n=1 Tax=Delitschia confertaspora ATCC 74209 TaxID=1513339 RepID=A0A9P4JU16_9PLEO|nr:transcription factor IIA, alpha/beta subunit [Delitschia confertaspora ATCC 74209]
MSNQIVGTVYQQIIERVIAASQNDFEEFGVDNSTLHEMQQGWQEKLSVLKPAQFPWDPQPEPARHQPPTVPSNVKHEQDLSAGVPSVSHEQLNFPNIKAERYDVPMSTYPPMPMHTYTASGLDGNIAQQRARSLIAQRQGSHPNMGMQNTGHHGGQMPQQRMQVPGQPQQGQPPQQQMQRPAGVYTPQTDGADEAMEDWKALMAAKAAEGDNGPNGRIAADRLMRAQIDALAMRLDSGLMVPLEEMPKGKRRKAAMTVLQEQGCTSAVGTSTVPGIASYDGAEDDEDKKTDDEDAINSELDDPDDLDNNDDDDDDLLDYMLCTYDKVQRVKNKWKCTLKDGVLMSNKKEYLFHKATGEFEW